MFNSVTPLQEKISEVANANGEALKSMVNVALNASEQLLALNLNVLRSYTANIAKPTSGNTAEQMTAQFKSPAKTLELTSDYLRNVSGICLKTQSEFAQLNVERISELNQSVSAMLDDMAKSGPKGTAEVVEQVKSALGSMTEAYENMIRTTSEIAESNLAAASSALEPMVAVARTESKVSKKAA